MLCNGKKLTQGVYLMEGIVQGKNGYAKVAVVNSNDTPIEIENSVMTAELNDLKEYDQYEVRYEEKLKHRDRIKYLRENLPMSHCNENEKKAIDWIITNYSDVFFIEGDMATFTEASQHYIPLKPGTQPIFTPQYKIPQAHREIIDQHIDKLVEDDIVEDSTSRWNSPVLLVPKKENARGEKQYRLVVDFRRLNEATETQTFPMPDLEEELSKTHGSTIFSTKDLNAAFHQIPLAESDKELTSFQTTTRKLQFKRMPFGLKGSPITWQRTINSILSDSLIKNNMAYMDDIISYNKSLQEHLKNLANILQRLRKFNLKLKVEKTKFMCKEVHYLGHIVGVDGIRTDPRKIECMSNFPIPKTLVELQRFLGMCNYYRKYVEGYSKITKPMNTLCKNDVPFIWSKACNESFEQLKQALSSAPILIFPNFRETFYVTTDASDYAIGAVLSQGAYPDDRPIQYFSKSLDNAQRNYATIHKELLSIILAIDQFRHYLVGRVFVVVTDHKPLTALFSQSKLNGRLLRWKIELSEYDFKIIHLAGKLNAVADCLSRIKNEEPNYKPKYLHEFMNESIGATILQVQTRSRTRETQLLKNNGDNGKNEQINTYTIEERNHVQIEQKNFDQIYYLLNSMKCNIIVQQIQIKFKTKIKFSEPLTYYQLYKIDSVRKIVFIPNIDGS